MSYKHTYIILNYTLTENLYLPFQIYTGRHVEKILLNKLTIFLEGTHAAVFL